jgi:hypothetical protein
MSIASTYSVTREFAIEAIKKKLDDRNTTDEQIANMLQEAIHNGFYNFRIEDDMDIREKVWNCERFYLDDIDNLPEYNEAW